MGDPSRPIPVILENKELKQWQDLEAQPVFSLLICLRFIIGSVEPKLLLMKLCTLGSGEIDEADWGGGRGVAGVEYGGGT